MTGERFFLTVNGVAHEVVCEPSTPLLYVLRNDLGLVGAKFGCGIGLCGACNVLLDGEVVHSCDTPVWSVVGRSVVTVEGLPPALPEAFIACQAMQCGYCIPGMVVTASALLEREPTVDEAGVRAALDGNLCRCGAHNRIVAAVLSAGSSP